MMRGISNIISALFVVAVILISAYTATTAYVQYSAELADAAKKSIERRIYANGISYGVAECNADAQKIQLKYTGYNPEYTLRFVCYDERNALTSICVVPFVHGGVLSARYVSSSFPEKIELNIAGCQGADLVGACTTNHIRCVAVGAYTTKEIIVESNIP